VRGCCRAARADHELLEAFHADLRHLGRCVAVEELRDAAVSGRQHLETGLQEGIVADLGARVDRQLAQRLVQLGLDVGVAMKARNFFASSTFLAPAGMWIVSVGASSARGTSGVIVRERP
jgi:hypothetical protein